MTGEMIRAYAELEGLDPVGIPAELVQIATELRADNVTLFRDRQGAARLAVIVEVQQHIDPDKRRTWPSYVTTTRARHNCPTLLLVLAMDPKVASWARASIAIGHPGFCLKPIVISKKEILSLCSPELARRIPQLAVLRGIAQGTAKGAASAIAAVQKLPDHYRQFYVDLILSRLPVAEQQSLEDQMRATRCVENGYVYRSNLALRNFARGMRVAVQTTAMKLARLKLGKLSSAERTCIRRVVDEHQLSALVLELAQAKTPEEVRAVIKAASARALAATPSPAAVGRSSSKRASRAAQPANRSRPSTKEITARTARERVRDFG